MHWYLEALRKYADFDGRARRKEFLYFNLFHMLVVLGLWAVDIAVGADGFLPVIYALAVVIPAVAVGVRRLHDTGRSAGWLLIGFFPIVGTIALVIFFVQNSQPYTNDYGPNPKLVESGVASGIAYSGYVDPVASPGRRRPLP
jgi:uncharacterized membrane protein YhaH (DUF805 family)